MAWVRQTVGRLLSGSAAERPGPTGDGCSATNTGNHNSAPAVLRRLNRDRPDLAAKVAAPRRMPELFGEGWSNARQRASAGVERLDGQTINSGRGPIAGEKTNRHIMPITPDPASDLRGTGSDYLTRRIVRDHPDIAERMKAGEYRSIRAAALDAGIVQRTLSVRLDDPARRGAAARATSSCGR
jgi:hypothetical protein